MPHHLKGIGIIILAVLCTLLIPASVFGAASGTYEKGISLINDSEESVFLWFGHAEPSAHMGIPIAPENFELKFAGLKYTDQDVDGNLYYSDKLRVNAMKAGDVDPYPTHIVQTFSLSGWLDIIKVHYNNGALTLDVTYSRENAPAPVITTTATAAEDSGVRFSGLNGQVEIAPGSNPQAKSIAKMDTVISFGDHIYTEEDSSAILVWVDKSSWVMKAESHIVIDSAGASKVTRGSILANVKKILETGSMDIEMNQAVLGIKGTTFICEQNDDGTSVVKVIEGSVQVTEKTYGAKVTLSDGQTVTAGADGFAGPVKTFDAAADTTAWEAVRTEAQAAAATVGSTTDDANDEGGSFPVVPVVIGVAVVFIVVFLVARSSKKK